MKLWKEIQMSLIVRLTPDSPFDDRLDREAIARYCIQKHYTYVFSDRYAPIDMYATKPDGVRVALELTCNACWITQLAYPEPYIHIPRRKWKTFYEQVRDISGMNVVRAEDAYLVVLNKGHTRAAFVRFSDILDDLPLFDEVVIDIYNDPTIFVLVPVSYILKYRDIPPA